MRFLTSLFEDLFFWVHWFRADPTRFWHTASTVPPLLDLEGGTVGGIGFGAGLEQLQVLGKPTVFTWKNWYDAELLYAPAGWLLELRAGKLAYVAFLIGPDSCLPVHSELAFCRPTLIDGSEWSPDSSPEMAQAHFGPPHDRDEDEEEIILIYRGNTFDWDLEFTPAGSLKRINANLTEAGWAALDQSNTS